MTFEKTRNDVRVWALSYLEIDQSYAERAICKTIQKLNVGHICFFLSFPFSVSILGNCLTSFKNGAVLTNQDFKSENIKV